MPQFPFYSELLCKDGLAVAQGNSTAASSASQARMYYDSASGHMRFSENTGAGFSVGKVRSISSVSLTVASLTADGILDVDVDETWAPTWVSKHSWLGAGTTTVMNGWQVVADTNDRVQITAGGIIQWGSGAASVDTNLYRSAANLLKTDDSFQALSVLAQDVSAFIKVNNGSTDTFHVNASGAVVAGSWTATAVAIGYGGTGASTAQNARLNLLPSITSQTGKYLRVNAGETDVEWVAGVGGAVTSVALSMPAGQFSVSGSPITTSGTFSVSWNNQNANYFLAGPSSGGAGSVSFRVITGNDLGSSPSSGGVLYLNGSALTWLSAGGTGALLRISAGVPSWLAVGTARQILMVDNGAPAWRDGNTYVVEAPTTGNSSADGTSTSSWLTLKDSGGSGSNNLKVTVPSSSDTTKPYYLIIARLSILMQDGSSNTEFDGALRLVYDPGGAGESVLDIAILNFTPTDDTNGDTWSQTLMGIIQAGSSSKDVVVQLRSNQLESSGCAWPYVVHADATFGNPCSRIMALRLV